MKTNVVDCFPYFNEKEILELRINLLNDYVDKFIIVDANYTHSGVIKNYTAKKTIDELNLPKNKIEVIELDMSDESLPLITDYERIWNIEKTHISRERAQRDAIAKCLETNDFDNDTLFIVGDCDEIINPEYIDLYKNLALNNRDKIFKVDLVQLEGRADMRVYYKNTQTPREWCYSLFVCLKSHIENVSLTYVRANIMNPYPVVWAHDGTKMMRDLGWHFSWMGNNCTRLLKSESFCHHDQELDFLKHTNYSSDDMKNFLQNYNFYENEICPSGDTKFIIKRYPVEHLPQIIFDIPRVKQFLLP
jgi:beta-1,4-mannosyl-glycoprotein beta-1,4-N-acetylglucosaminyltransferase